MRSIGRSLLLTTCLAIFHVTTLNAQSAVDSVSGAATIPPSPEESVASDLDALLDLADRDISQLSQVRVAKAPSLETVVTTVQRKESTVGKTPAAVFVITNDMIRRSGARSIPEVLRMAPGVQVSRIDGNKWVVTIRGFGSRFANKLLVQIDGRSVYTPMFGGVFWDIQDVILEDVERIEVIRGPGGTIWGANAVNGVINIITKSSKDTQGTFVEAGGGTERAYSSARHGGELSDNATYRVYGKWFERDQQVGIQVAPTDDWRSGRGGFRIDWDISSQDSATFQGDVYNTISGTTNIFAAPNAPFFRLQSVDWDSTGGNLLYRFNHKISDDSDWQVQAYWDHNSIDFHNLGGAYERNTLDIDFQQRFVVNRDHEIVWGFDYRWHKDDFDTVPFVFQLGPNQRSYDRVGVFAQDTMTLLDDELFFTVGGKVSHNDFTDFEYQPSARLLWTPTDEHSIWTSVSRTVRTPTRAEVNGRVVRPAQVVPMLGTVFPIIMGNPNLDAEDLISYEIGFRHQPEPWFSWDVAMFYNDYTDLVTFGLPSFPFPGPEGLVSRTFFMNGGSAETYGVELSANLELSDRWRLHGHYSYLHMDVRGASIVGQSGDSPQNQLYFQSTHDLLENWELDLIGRYVDSLPAQRVPSYLTMDIRLGWHPKDGMEFFVVGRNLLDQSHPQFGNDIFLGSFATELRREVYAGMAFRF